MFIDTHCHLNFRAFTGGDEKIARRAQECGVSRIVIPGTDIDTSQMAIEIAGRNPVCYAAVGLHPHHIQKYISSIEALEKDILTIESLTSHEKVVAVGEIGLDRHVYRTSKYGPEIEVSEEYFGIQLIALKMQVELALHTQKSVILHNRESATDLIRFIMNDLTPTQRGALQGKVVFHCCEPDIKLLEVARTLGFYIGVDGDVTFDTLKRDFISKVPLSMLVLETDAPYILPEPMKSEKKYPNLPAYIPLIAQAVAELKQVSIAEVADQTTKNAINLYQLPK